MLHNLPLYISIVFLLTTLATLLMFYWTIKSSTVDPTRRKAVPIVIACSIWLAIQAVLTLKGLYNSNVGSLPPKILLFGVAPAIITIVFVFVTKAGRTFIDSLPLINITFLNVIRIPVELVLLWLYINKAVPQLMTFEGRNFDILAGITAPFIAYFGFAKARLSGKIILTWNIVCLALLANIVVNALLSAPFPLQKFAFDQPDVAILNFPFSWLPSFIVPIVLFGHFVSIRQLTQRAVKP